MMATVSGPLTPPIKSCCPMLDNTFHQQIKRSGTRQTWVQFYATRTKLLPPQPQGSVSISAPSLRMHKAPEAHAGSALRIQIFLSLGPAKEHNHLYPGFWLRVASQSPACTPRTTQSPFSGYPVSKKGLTFLLPFLPSLASPQEQ